MPVHTRAELALEKLLQAESKAQAYARICPHNPKLEKQLAHTIEAAINEFIAQTARPRRKGLKIRGRTLPRSLTS
jgi:phage gpG-like protein